MKTKSIGITKRQQDTLNFMKQFKEEKGYMPTVREICKGINVTSPATVHTHLKELINKGYIEFGGGNRTYIIIEDTPKEDKKIKKLAVNLYCDEDKTFKREVNDKINEIIDMLNGEDNE